MHALNHALMAYNDQIKIVSADNLNMQQDLCAHVLTELNLPGMTPVLTSEQQLYWFKKVSES